MKDCLIIFAKEPKAGKVKTRLEGGLSKAMCVKLYKAFLKDTLNLAKAIKYPYKVLAYESSATEPRYLKTIAKSFLFYKQEGRNLGDKMYNAFKFANRMNYKKTVIIGSDSPNLPVKHIREAYHQLDKNDVILGPSHDGGYYLIGLKKPCMEVFRNIKWSSNTVLKDTVKNAKKINKKVSILNKWYDIDNSFALALLKEDLKKDKKAAPWTRKLLKI